MGHFLHQVVYGISFIDYLPLFTFFVLQFVAMAYWYKKYQKARHGLGYFQEVMRSSKDAWVKINKSDKSVYISNKGIGILGLDGRKSGEVSFDVFLSLFDGSAVGVLENKITALVSNGNEFEVVITLNFNNERHVRIRGVNLTNDYVIIWLSNASSEIFERNYQSQEIVHLSNLKNKLLNVLNAIPTPVWIRNNKGIIEYCNTRYADLLDTNYTSILDKQNCLWGKCDLVDGIVSPIDENKYIVSKGSRHFFHFKEEMMGGALLGFAEEKTEVRKLQKKIEKVSSTNKEILQNLSVGITIYDNNKRLVFFNNAYVKIFNLDVAFLSSSPTLGEVLDKLRSNKMLPEFVDYREFKKNNLEDFSTLDHTKHDLSHLPDGRSIKITQSPSLLGGVFFVFEDVTDRLDLERQFNTLVAVQKKTIDNLYEGVAVFGKDSRLTFCNTSFKNIWNIKDNSMIIGMSISDLLEMVKNSFFFGSDWLEYKAKLTRYSTDRNYKRKVFEKRDGSVIEFSYIPLPDGNHMISCQDITSAQNIEKALRERNEALEDANNIKVDFISNISTELYKPMQEIHKNALKVYENCKDHSRSAYYEYRLLKNSESVYNLVRRVLDLVKISSGNANLEKSEVDIYDLLSLVYKNFRPVATNKKVLFKIECSKKIGEYMLDKNKIQAVLSELVDNSIKFSNQKGKVLLSAKVDQKNIVFSVTDDGVGIKYKDHSKIFEHFNKVSDTKFYSGLGIGLSLVKNIVELHGGKIKLNSSTRKGTKIECYIPIEKPIIDMGDKEGDAARNSQNKIVNLSDRIVA